MIETPVKVPIFAFDLFRYIPSPHQDDLIKNGKLLVGTLKKYRDTMADDIARGDVSEGKITIFNTVDYIDDPTNITDVKKKNFIESFAKLSPAGKGHKFENIKLINETPNCLVLCLSNEKNNPRQKAEFGENCFQIKDLKKTMQTLTQTLQAAVEPIKIKQCLLMPIIYRPKEMHYSFDHEKTHPIWLKDPSYKWQTEFRMIWEVDQPEKLKEFYILENFELSKLFEKVI